jgi:hypothetical protein
VVAFGFFFFLPFFLYLFFLVKLEFELGSSRLQALYHLSHFCSPFFSGYFGDGILQTVCPGWP